MKRNSSLFYLLFFLFLIACQKKAVFVQTESNYVIEESDELIYSVFLIGDAGGDTADSRPVFKNLAKELDQANPNQSILAFLGDNIYPLGLHAKKHKLYSQDTSRINAQLKLAKKFKGKSIFISGNHDWKQGGKEGLKYVKRQEDYIQDYLGKKVFHPSDGCAGPKEISLSDDLVLVCIDTQWWLHQKIKARGAKDDCSCRTKEDFITDFKEILKSNREKNILVIGHHPLFSTGSHGGYFTVKDHLFPLTSINKNWWIPMPVIGSIYPFYRSFFGDIQDIPHPQYQSLIQGLFSAMNEYENVVYAAGHEHNLQYTQKERLHHIISGAGSKKTVLKFNKRIEFGAYKRGYAKLNYYASGKVILSFMDGENEGKILFQKQLYTSNLKKFQNSKSKSISYAGKTEKVIPDSNYQAGKVKRFFFGDLNRDVWTKEIEVPVLDLHQEYGGLTPVGKGGGMQTLSLKMMGGDGHVYKLRGIKKNADFLVERDLRGTLAQDVIYDGIAGSHPYASVIVPKIANAANIYYTEPRLVYIPKDSILGDYLDEFGGMFALLEVHPNDDMSEYANFGNSDKVMSTGKVIQKLEADYKYKIDKEHLIRSRLVDMFLGDWDRHDDQWRWARLKDGDKYILRAIPRDRDQVFFQFDGFVMKIANRKWLQRKFQNFSDDVRDIAGLNFNARYFDRYFLNEANQEDWMKEAKYLQQVLSDEVLLEALQDFPKEAFEHNGLDLFENLKARRKKLLEFAERYYEVLSREVSIHGTLNKDYFLIERLPNGDVEVKIYPIKKGKIEFDQIHFQRLFKRSETKEINIFGLDENDQYQIKGKSKRSIKVRLIAGDQKDEFVDSSSVLGWSKKTIIYDTKKVENTNLGSEAKRIIRKEENALLFNRKAFKYDVLRPIPSIGFNVNDGFFIGPGFQLIKHGFNKVPYKEKHDFKANYTIKAEGFNIEYGNEFVDLLGRLDFRSRFEINYPEVYQFYGLGNETKIDEERFGNSSVRQQNFASQISVVYSSKENASSLIFSGGYERVNIEEIPPVGLLFENRKKQEFTSTGLTYEYFNADQRVNPTKGIHFQLGAEYKRSTINDDVAFMQYQSKLAVYVPINWFKRNTTLAFRLGAATNEGDYNFYHANYLSGIGQLRGITRNRYAGESVSYNNIEIRKSFMKVSNYVALFDFGALVHYDIGRVWIGEIDESNFWHQSTGLGVYLSVLDFVSLVGTYSISNFDQNFNFGTKFYF